MLYPYVSIYLCPNIPIFLPPFLYLYLFPSILSIYLKSDNGVSLPKIDTIDVIDSITCNRRIDEAEGVEYIILSVQDNALGVTEGLDDMQGIDASVGRAGRCYHWLLED